jgi:superoxide dismutase, Cu-Zn family
MRRTLAAMLTVAGCLAATQAEAESANAVLVDPDGKEIGNVALSQLAQGVRIFAEARDVPPGVHAFHIHETGDCQAPDFESAGGHYNPTSEQHGWDNPEGHHAGDLPNVQVRDDGVLAIEYFTDSVTLGEGDATLFDDDGSAIVLHAGADDHQTDPTGDAGSRIACGVIAK